MSVTIINFSSGGQFELFCNDTGTNFSGFFLVPFAVEEKTGTISVVDDVNKYDRLVYNFEAVATNDVSMSLSTNVTIHVAESDSSSVIRY